MEFRMELARKLVLMLALSSAPLFELLEIDSPNEALRSCATDGIKYSTELQFEAGSEERFFFWVT
jgi:hypothetical protein